MNKASFGLLVFTACVWGYPPAASAQDLKPRFQTAGNQVVALSNLYVDPACVRRAARGRVVKRDFDDVGIVPVSLVLETGKGQRSLVNIDKFTIDHASEADKESLLKGLQTILAVGRDVEAGTLLCGAAGRVAILSSVRPAGR